MNRLQEALASLKEVTATTSRDWSANMTDAWIYGVVWGWDFEEYPEEPSAMAKVARLHGWPDDYVHRLRQLHIAFEEAIES